MTKLECKLRFKKDGNDFKEIDIDSNIYRKIEGRIRDVNENTDINISEYEENREIIIENFLNEDKKVNDVCRYILTREGRYYTRSDNQKTIKNSDYKDDIVKSNENIKSIIIILESPHQYEYNDKFEPKAPAQGKTGEGIEFYIELIIYHLIKREGITLDDDKYNVIICNPVQYQASLYHLHNNSIEGKYKTLRNNVWKKLFDDETKKDFIDRVKSYKPKLIINACTSDLKDCVQEELYKEFSQSSDVEMIKSYHPSSWGCLGIEVKK